MPPHHSRYQTQCLTPADWGCQKVGGGGGEEERRALHSDAVSVNSLIDSHPPTLCFGFFSSPLGRTATEKHEHPGQLGVTEARDLC